MKMVVLREGGLNLSELGLNFKYENVNKENSTIKVKKTNTWAFSIINKC